MNVGENIKHFREIRNFTQEHMANSLGLSINGYGKIEWNETKLTLDRLGEIAEVLDVDTSDILNFDERYIFNSISHNQTGGETKSGIFHNEADKLFITDIKNQVDKLIEQNNRLVAIVEKLNK